MTGLKWTRRTTAKIARELQAFGIDVDPKTAAKVLKQLGLSLRVNHKKRSNGSPKQIDQQIQLAPRLNADGRDRRPKPTCGSWTNAGGCR